MSRFLSLDDTGGLSPDEVGGKAALLAAARQRGFPVLGGLVLPARESRAVLDVGRQALDAHGGAAGRRAIYAMSLEELTAEEQSAVAALGDEFVVRSSTCVDDDGAWSGAFASYGNVMAADLPAAIRGCRASVFSQQAQDRLDETARTLDDIGLSILIQPYLDPLAGGWAAVEGGRVTIVAVPGHPGALLGGWVNGTVIEVDGDAPEPPAEIPAELPFGRDAAIQLIALARRAASDLGANRIEWALAPAGLVILQIGTLTAGSATEGSATSERPDARYDLPAARRLTALLLSRRGRLADVLLVPWAGAAGQPAASAAGGHGDERASWIEARRRSAGLAGDVSLALGMDPGTIAVAVAAGDEMVLARLSEVILDPAAAGAFLGAMDELAASLVGRGLLDDRNQLWWQTVEWVNAAVEGRGAPRADRPLDPYSDFLFGAVSRTGADHGGAAASPGRAVGPAVLWDPATDAGLPPGGSILVLREPVSNHAPLLWRAAGAISGTGSRAAHLVEVARSLHVPVVVSARIAGIVHGTPLAIDGDTGAVWVGRHSA